LPGRCRGKRRLGSRLSTTLYRKPRRLASTSTTLDLDALIIPNAFNRQRTSTHDRINLLLRHRSSHSPVCTPSPHPERSPTSCSRSRSAIPSFLDQRGDPSGPLSLHIDAHHLEQLRFRARPNSQCPSRLVTAQVRVLRSLRSAICAQSPLQDPVASCCRPHASFFSAEIIATSSTRLILAARITQHALWVSKTNVKLQRATRSASHTHEVTRHSLPPDRGPKRLMRTPSLTLPLAQTVPLGSPSRTCEYCGQRRKHRRHLSAAAETARYVREGRQ